MDTLTTKGSQPQFNPATEGKGLYPLFHSRREQALIVDRFLGKGFGIVKGGVVLSRTVGGKYFVYPTTDHLTLHVARAFGIADIADAQNYIDVPLSQINFMEVGDPVFLVRNNAGAPDYHDGGAITAINLEQGSYYGRVTFTNAVSGANFTVANAVNVYLSGGAFTGGLKANCILDIDVDTGGADGVGAGISAVYSNAVLYSAYVEGLDTAAATDLGAVVDAPYVFLK